MELVCGETARDRVARKGPLSEAEAIEIVLGATRGLEAAHKKGIVHRDIKPENIMIDATGVVKLADLGIAKVLEEGGRSDSQLTQPGSVMGTPSFMPPEQFTDPSTVTFAGDVYSMGATLYFLLTAKLPFAGTIIDVYKAVTSRDFPDVRKDRPQLSERVYEILRTCTHRSPAARYADASALILALEMSGTDRKTLRDAGTGTVTAVARVSTPPARRVGEIRLEIPAEDAASRGAATKVLAPSRRGLLALGGIFLCAAVFAGGLLYYLRNLPERPGSVVGPAAPPAAGASAAPAAPVVPAREAREAAGVQTPRPKPSPAPAAEKTAPEKTTAQKVAVEKAAVENVAAERTAAEKTAVPAVPAADARSARELLDRARGLAGIDTIAALNILNILNRRADLQGLEPEVAQVRVLVLLKASPAREKESQACVRTLCALPDAAKPGSPCDRAYLELLAEGALVPREGSSPAVFLSRLVFLKGLGPPPEGLAGAEKGYESARKDILLGTLKAMAAQARDAVKADDVAKAQDALDRAFRFLKEESIEGAFPEETALLAAERDAAAVLEAEKAAWLDLRSLIPSDPAALAALSREELSSRAARFAKFAEAYPEGRHRPAADLYRGRYEAELVRRKGKD
ncbi:MAG: serine/threonine protein kinase [Planctomycetes bacterium]|nr:serine/threonine protein kinase [Planctomycetota bacterium]